MSSSDDTTANYTASVHWSAYKHATKQSIIFGKEYLSHTLNWFAVAKYERQGTRCVGLYIGQTAICRWQVAALLRSVKVAMFFFKIMPSCDLLRH
jgi:hypothetical protein